MSSATLSALWRRARGDGLVRGIDDRRWRRALQAERLAAGDRAGQIDARRRGGDAHQSERAEVDPRRGEQAGVGVAVDADVDRRLERRRDAVDRVALALGGRALAA